MMERVRQTEIKKDQWVIINNIGIKQSMVGLADRQTENRQISKIDKGIWISKGKGTQKERKRKNKLRSGEW